MSPANLFLSLGAVFAGLGVGLGAFGAHALKARVSEDMLVIFETGVRYQMYHSFALLVVGILLQVGLSSPWLSRSGWLFLVGILIFSGSLYILSLSGVKTWGAVTPLGGLAFLGAWACLAFSCVKG